MQSRRWKLKCVHLPSIPLELCNPGDHISREHNFVKQPVDGFPKCAIQFVLQDLGGSSNNMLTVRALSFKQTENMHCYCYRYKEGRMKKYGWYLQQNYC